MGLAIRLDYEGFERFLTNEKKRNARQIMSYAKRYGHVLQTGNAREIMQLGPNNRRHCMEAIVYFSKYLGVYQIWKEIKERYALQWTVQNDMAIFQNMIDAANNYESMLEWLKQACQKVPHYKEILVYGAITGLRAAEICYSINLLRSDFDGYYDKDRRILLHFKYPQIFIRNTKKAYISVVTDGLIHSNYRHITYSMIRKAVERAGLQMNLGFTRKIFATYLYTNGIDSQTIDLLQGRLPKTVFARHYNRPNFEKEIEKVRACLNNLSDSIK